MDILKQYEKQDPEISHVSAPQEFQDESSLVRTVMRLSGGRIRDPKQANYVLLGFAIILIVVSLFLFFNTGSNSKNFLPPNFYQIDQSQYERR